MAKKKLTAVSSGVSLDIDRVLVVRAIADGGLRIEFSDSHRVDVKGEDAAAAAKFFGMTLPPAKESKTTKKEKRQRVSPLS